MAEPQWVIGVVLSLLASVINNLGLALQARPSIKAGGARQSAPVPTAHQPAFELHFGDGSASAYYDSDDDDAYDDKDAHTRRAHRKRNAEAVPKGGPAYPMSQSHIGVACTNPRCTCGGTGDGAHQVYPDTDRSAHATLHTIDMDLDADADTDTDAASVSRHRSKVLLIGDPSTGCSVGPFVPTPALKTRCLRACKTRVAAAFVSAKANRMELLGLACLVLGACLDVASYAFAPLSLLAPLGSASLVMNLVVAKHVLREPRARVHWFACGIVITGTLLAVVFGSKSSPRNTLDRVISGFGTTTFVMYATWVVCAHSLTLTFAKKALANTTAQVRAGVRARARVAAGVLWCFAASHIGSVGVAAAKVLAEVATGSTPQDLFRPVSFVLIIAVLLAMKTQLRYTNRALALTGALLTVPTSQVFTLVFNLLAGCVVFQDYTRMAPPGGLVFGAGVVIALGGTGVLVAYGVREAATAAAAAGSASSMHNQPLSNQPSAAAFTSTLYLDTRVVV